MNINMKDRILTAVVSRSSSYSVRELNMYISRQPTFDSLSTVELDLSLPLWRVGLDHDEGTSRDSTVEFPLGPAGARQRWRRVMRGAWVSLH